MWKLGPNTKSYGYTETVGLLRMESHDWGQMNITLGPLTTRLKGEASWGDRYPAWQVYADECERLLQFLQTHNQLDRYWPRLIAKRQQRDEALNEMRVAWFLESLGYSVSDWEPTDAPGFKVEFAVNTGPHQKAFVEVKSPGWESELTEAERKNGRTKPPKYIDMEGRAAGPIQLIQRTVAKAGPKFTGKSPSLIIVSDDCFVNLGDWGWGPLQIALTQNSIAWGEGLFCQFRYNHVGAVGLCWLGQGAQYRSICIANPNAILTATLPSDMVAKLTTTPMEPALHSPRQGTIVVP